MDNADTPLPVRLRNTVEHMLNANERISTRNIMARMPDDFKYPTAITRPKALRDIYLDGRTEQKRLREVASRCHSSRMSLEAKILRQAETIATLKSERAVLIASHRAMYSAVGELGGGRAWLKFFESHQATLQLLRELQAVPPPVTTLRPLP